MRAGRPWNWTFSCASRIQREQRLVLGEEVEHGLVGGGDVARLARQRGPAERALALAEQRPDVGGDEAREVERALVAAQLRLGADRVAVVEDLGAGVHEADHRLDVPRHRLARFIDKAGLRARLGPVLEGDAGRQVGERVVGARLVGHDVDRRAAAQQLREHVGAVAEQADRQGPCRLRRQVQRVVEADRLDVEVAAVDTPRDARLVDVDADRHAAVHRHRERLRAAHPAEPAGQRDRALQRPAEALVGDRRERLVGALEDALGADVDPRAGRHLAVHRQPERVEAPELVPRRPVADEVGVGEQHARRPLVRLQHADGLAGLDQQRLVVLQRLQRALDRVQRRVVTRRLARAAVDDQLLGVLGDVRVEVVVQHPQRGFLRPAEAFELEGLGHASSPVTDSAARRAPPLLTNSVAASISGARKRSGPGPGRCSSTAAVASAGSSGARSWMPRAAVSSSIASTCDEPVDRAPQLAPGGPAHRDVVLLHRRARDAVHARGRGEALELGHQRRLRVLGDHQPGVDTRVVGQERRQAVAARLVEEAVGAPLGHAREVGDGDRQEVEHVADGRAVEVAVGLDRGRRA